MNYTDMKIISVLLVTALSAVQAQLGDRQQVQAPYLDSITVQDSCQFSLCGPQYTQEFLEGKQEES